MRDARWLRALTLEERLELGGEIEHDAERGEARLTRWIASAGPFGEELLTRRIEHAGITRDTLVRVLGESATQLADRAGDRVAWLDELAARFGTTEPSGVEHAGPLRLLAPAIDRGIARLRAGAPRDVAPLLDDLIAPLHVRLVELLERPTATEVQSASLLGLLEGETSEARFASFVARLDDPAARAEILADYPAMARLVATWIDQWVDSSLELLTRIDADRSELDDTFGALGDPVGMRAGDSDPHHGGRHVWFVEFASGTVLVYKPRSLGPEAAFQQFVARVNGAGLQPPLRTLGVVARETHGWMELVEARPCADAGEVERFHWRLGAWLAVLHVLAATDVHYENLIASGEHPVPIDHETLLASHPYSMDPEDGSAEEAARLAMHLTVLGTDLLKAAVWHDATGRPMDIGGMGGGYGDLGEIPAFRILDEGTDEMRIGLGTIVAPSHRNRASLDGETVDARAHRDDIIAGFTAARAALGTFADDPSELLEPFRGMPTRTVLRPTAAFADLLTDLHHPTCLGDALECEWMQLGLWADNEHQPWRVPMLASEYAQLPVGDVPYFRTTAGGDDLVGGDGTVIPGLVLVRGLDTAYARFARLDGRDLARNQWTIGATLATRDPGEWHQGIALDGATPLELALSVGDRLVEAAIHDGTGELATWLSVSMLGNQGDDTDRFVPGVIGAEVYEGVAGVALHLAELGAVTGEARYRDVAEAAARTLATHDGDARSVGGFEGWGARIYAWVRLAALLDDPSLADRAEALVPRLLATLPHDGYLDVIAGSAGAIPCLLALDAVRPASGALDAAIACGDHLVQRTADPDTMHFARGFSHGLAGVAWALARLHERTGEERFRDAALDRVERERALIAESGTWADDDVPGRAHMCAWCHGAAGIALARLETWRLFGRRDDDLLEEARAGLGLLAADRPMPNHCLCHGQLGNLDILTRACEVLGDEWTARRDDVAAAVLADIRSRGAVCATPQALESPSLLTGLAGIGHGLLRLARPGEVPSVLLLESPSTT